MPFQRRDLARVASASTGSHAMWLYLSETDDLQAILAADYFGEISPQLRENDVIFCSLSNQYYWFKVVSRNPSIKSVIVSEITFGSTLQQVARFFSFDIQEPVGLDNPLQLTFGGAQGGPTDPIQIDANGLITFNKTTRYQFRIGIQFGRIGVPGTALLFGRALFNGVQVGNSVYAEIDDSTDKIPTRFSGTLPVTEGDTFALEIYRDSQGSNAGGVYSGIPNLVGWNDVPSCFIIFEEFG